MFPKRNKYRNIRVKIDGYSFDSKKESEKYMELKIMKQNGEIKDFTVHPKFKIIDAFEKDGIKYRATYYVADFSVTKNDDTVEIIDIKPYSKKHQKFLLTAVFKLKARLFDIKYPDLILCIE